MTTNDFDIDKAPLEIERKYLISYPDLDILKNINGYKAVHIEQTYLEDRTGNIKGRIRKITDGDFVKYVYTFKKSISPLTRREYEREITEYEYEKLLNFKREDSGTIVKDRHSFEYNCLTYEIDIYSFWSDRAILEAEISNENTMIAIPPFISLIKEVTFDKRYTNASLSRKIFTENI